MAVYKQYQIIQLKEDLNPIIRKGMQGIILEIWNKNNFEVEFLDDDGVNLQFNGNATFTISSDMMEPVVFNPPPRSFEQWCVDLGFEARGNCPPKNTILDYNSFIFFPNITYYKVMETQLYNSARYYGEQGQSRTAKEFLEDLEMELTDPTQEDEKELNRIFEYDEFWRWSSGKVLHKHDKHQSLLEKVKQLFLKK